MKNLLNNLKNALIILYILLIIFITICLLSYNDYRVTEFGNTTVIPIIDEDLEPNYTVGDLVIVEKKSLARVEAGDVIFFYRTSSGITTINFAKVIKSERVTDTEFTYTVEGDYRFSSSNFIGEVEDTTVIPKVGSVLSLLQSKWGFLLLGVFPSLVAFLCTLHNVVLEIQDVKEAEEKARRKKKKKKKVKTENVEKTEAIEEKVETKEVKQEVASEEKNETTVETEQENEEVVVEVSVQAEKTEVAVENETKIESQEVTVEVEENKEPVKEENKEVTVEIEKEEVKEETVKQEEPKKELTAEEKKKALIE